MLSIDESFSSIKVTIQCKRLRKVERGTYHCKLPDKEPSIEKSNFVLWFQVANKPYIFQVLLTAQPTVATLVLYTAVCPKPPLGCVYSVAYFKMFSKCFFTYGNAQQAPLDNGQ